MRALSARFLLSLILCALVLSGCASEISDSTNNTEDETSGGDDTLISQDTTPEDSGKDTTEEDQGQDLIEPDLVEDSQTDEGEEDTAVDTAPDVPPAPPGSVSGVVWAPGSAPGMAEPGQEIPVYGADVFLTQSTPSGIPQQAYCEICAGIPASGARTDHKGTFSITQPPGDYLLVINKGQFRLVQEITITSDQTLSLNEAQTTLPSVHAPDQGKWTPRIAIAVGAHDHLEDIFGKIGMGGVDDWGEFEPESAVGYFDIWNNGGSGFSDVSLGDLDELVSDLNRMKQYHIIFIPCAGSSYTDVLSDRAVLENIRDYVAAGGKLYVTDWSGEWHDNVFPAAVTLEDEDTDTPPEAYQYSTDTWDPALFGDADGSHYDTPNAEATDPNLRAWLEGQQGPTIHSESTSTYNASAFEVEGNWNTIEATTPIQTGELSNGTPITNTPHIYVQGGSEADPTPKKPLTVTYEPAGCGRVLYSTYHTTDSTHLGLVPQERVLLYLIMEIGACLEMN